jgi:uncharacterized Tic20 family protein
MHVTGQLLAALSALLMFIGIPLGNILGPLLIWLIKRKEYAFVDDQGKAALNFQISMLIYVLAIVGIGILVLFRMGFSFAIFPIFLIAVAFEIADVALIVIAAMRSNEGISYRYPFSIEFLKYEEFSAG